jgi:hypothetical protein
MMSKKSGQNVRIEGEAARSPESSSRIVPSAHYGCEFTSTFVYINLILRELDVMQKFTLYITQKR